MPLHREPRDFRVLLEQYETGSPDVRVLGRGGLGIRPGHIIETAYHGAQERWRVRSIEARGPDTWSAVVSPVPVLNIV